MSTSYDIAAVSVLKALVRARERNRHSHSKETSRDQARAMRLCVNLGRTLIAVEAAEARERESEAMHRARLI